MPRIFGVKTVEIKIKEKKPLKIKNKRKTKIIHQSKVEFE